MAKKDNDREIYEKLRNLYDEMGWFQPFHPLEELFEKSSALPVQGFEMHFELPEEWLDRTKLSKPRKGIRIPILTGEPPISDGLLISRYCVSQPFQICYTLTISGQYVPVTVLYRQSAVGKTLIDSEGDFVWNVNISPRTGTVTTKPMKHCSKIAYPFSFRAFTIPSFRYSAIWSMLIGL